MSTEATGDGRTEAVDVTGPAADEPAAEPVVDESGESGEPGGADEPGESDEPEEAGEVDEPGEDYEEYADDSIADDESLEYDEAFEYDEDYETAEPRRADRKSTRLNSSHFARSRMPSSA